jgi:putative pyruvate formate lyase activating enzyme
VNVVTGTHFAPHVIAAVAEARARGLSVPVVWNTSGYERLETIEMLSGTVDVYLTDIKYTDDDIARRLSQADDYFRVATRAAKQMLEQVGPLEVDRDGLAVRGVVIRHLVLPDGLADTAGVMRHIVRNLGKAVPVSLMGQYFPAFGAFKTEPLHRPLSEEEYRSAKAAVRHAGVERGWFQEMDCPILKRGA